MRWVLVGIIGILTGITAFLINIGIFYLREFKNETFFIGRTLWNIRSTSNKQAPSVCICLPSSVYVVLLGLEWKGHVYRVQKPLFKDPFVVLAASFDN